MANGEQTSVEELLYSSAEFGGRSREEVTSGGQSAAHFSEKRRLRVEHGQLREQLEDSTFHRHQLNSQLCTAHDKMAPTEEEFHAFAAEYYFLSSGHCLQTPSTR